MKKILVLLLTISMITLVLFGCGSKANTEAPTNNSAGSSNKAKPNDKTFVIKFAHVEPVEGNGQVGALKFKELVEERSKRRVTVEVFPNSQLGNENDLLEAVKLGSVQMCLPSPGGVARFYAPFNAFMTPFYLNGSSEQEMLDSLMKVLKSTDIEERLNKGLIKAGNMRALAFDWWLGNRYLTTKNTAVTIPTDLKGLTIRTPDLPAYVKTMEAMGAAVTPMAFGEVYMALKQGVIGGQENPLTNIYNMRFHEVQKYLCMTGHITQTEIPVINETFFQSMPADLQEIVAQSLLDASHYQNGLQIKALEEKLKKLQDEGITVVDVNKKAFREATKNVADVILNDEGKAILKIMKEAQ